MLYTAHVQLDGDNIAARMSEIKAWLNRHDIEPVASQVRMDADGVRCRVDFKSTGEAAAFADAFAEAVVG